MTQIEDVFRAAAERVDSVAVETVSRAQIERTDDGSSFVHSQVSMLEGEVQEQVEVFVPHGLYFRPPAGAEGVALAVLGDPGHRVVLGAHAREMRPVASVEEGEGGLYSGRGWHFFVSSTGELRIGSGEGRSAGSPEGSDPDDAREKPALVISPDGTVTVMNKDGEPRLRLHEDGRADVFSDDVRVGSDSAADPVVRWSALQAELNTLKTALLAHTHVETGGTTDAPTAATSSALTSWPSDCGSDVLKVTQ